MAFEFDAAFWATISLFVFLASEDGSYLTGQVLHPNGGTVING